MASIALKHRRLIRLLMSKVILETCYGNRHHRSSLDTGEKSTCSTHFASAEVLRLSSHHPMLESCGQLRFPQSIICPINIFKHVLLRLMHLPGIKFSYTTFLDNLNILQVL